MKILKAATIFHHPNGNLNGDYYDVELVIEFEGRDGRSQTKTLTWGDDYHDKGQDRADAVVEAFKEFFGKFPHEEKSIDDRESMEE